MLVPPPMVMLPPPVVMLLVLPTLADTKEILPWLLPSLSAQYVTSPPLVVIFVPAA